MNKKIDERGRNWTFVLYPESMDPDYRSKLDSYHIQWCESPLHDLDVDLDGVIKKSHIHIVLCFEGNKTYEQIKEIASEVNGVVPPFCEAKVSSIRGMIRYLIHLDNPEKHQYERSAIIAHGGMDIEPYFQYPAEMIKRYLQEMMAWCDASSCFEYCDLLEFSCEEKYETWYDLLTIGRQSFVMIKYLDSKRNKYKKEIANE